MDAAQRQVRGPTDSLLLRGSSTKKPPWHAGALHATAALVEGPARTGLSVRPRPFRAFRSIVSFGGLRLRELLVGRRPGSRGIRRARGARGDHEGSSMASSGAPVRCPGQGSRARLLVTSGRFPDVTASRACGPSCESALTTPVRMAFIRNVSLGFCAHRCLGHGLGLSVVARSARTVIRGREPSAAASSLPVRERAQWASSAAAAGVLPFRALIPGRMGAGRPVPALLWLARQRSFAARPPLQGFVPRPDPGMGSGGTSGCSPRVSL